MTDYTKIYVVCPANNKTGGTELLHQLVYELNNQGKNAYIAYYFEGEKDIKKPTPKEFEKYLKSYKLFKEIEDEKDNILVVPEVCIGKHRKFKYIQKSVWWLSVDNFKVMLGKKNRLKRYGIKSFIKHCFYRDFNYISDLKKIENHFYQSYFAQSYLMAMGIDLNKTRYLSDYINDIYLKQDYGKQVFFNKKDIVIYNPKKGKLFTEKIISTSKNINFVPIENMDNIEVINLMKSAKVYIDFGNHPGKDRIPREAVMCGCCVITGREGSANFYNDVPILEKYKFDGTIENVNEIINVINKCIKNYDGEILNFKKYQEVVRKEKDIFKKDVSEIFFKKNYEVNNEFYKS